MAEHTFTVTNDRRQLETLVSFNGDAPLALTASNASGSVDIRTDNTLQAGTLRVAATRTDHGEFEEDDHHFTVRVEGNTVSVHPDWQFASGVSSLARRIRDQLQHGFRPEDWNISRLRLSPELDFDITITLPATIAEGSQVKVRTASGEVNVSNVVGNTSIVTASGDVEARQLTGTVAIHTASGDVAASDITESLEINTASGDVTIRGGDAWLAARSASGDLSIRDMRLRNSRITTVSGDVSLDVTLDNTASYGMETVSGDIDLTATLPSADATATLGFGTLSGSSRVGDGWQQRRRREWFAGTGDQAITISVKTVSGDLSARARLDPATTLRRLELPTPQRPETGEFEDEMKEFAREMKRFGKEMKHMATGDQATSPVPPTPPAPPTPPVPPTPQAERPGHPSHLFTAGPSGRDYRGTEAPAAQPTEPVTPPEPFTEEPAETPAGSAQETGPVTTPEPAGTAATDTIVPSEERLRVLELLEKGEIDIEDALARLEATKDEPAT